MSDVASAQNRSAPPPAEFDQHAADYAARVRETIAGSGVNLDALAASKIRLLLRLLQQSGLNPPESAILDCGCGVGLLTAHLLPHFRETVGSDVSPASIAYAEASIFGARFVLVPEGPLPFAAGSFDVAFCSGVLHHVPEEARLQFAADLTRVVRPGGMVAIFEHNPNNPVTSWIVKNSFIDKDAKMLALSESYDLLRAAGLNKLQAEFYGFAPWRIRVIEAIERKIAWIPFGAQYCVYGIVTRDPAC
jgi:SAM-dependent methyltransferase